MKTKLIKNDLYLLLIDEEAEIKKGDCILEKELIINIFPDYLTDLDECSKIIAYHSLTKEAKELDLPLLPNPFEEKIDIEILALKDLTKRNKNFDNIGRPDLKSNIDYENGYLDGAKFGVAQSHSKQFSLEDMKKAIEMARKTFPTDKLSCDRYSTEKIIQSLSIQQLPTGFIPKIGVREFKGYYRGIRIDNKVEYLETLTNSQGQKVVQGEYVY